MDAHERQDHAAGDATEIDATAVVHPNAELGHGVRVGPYSVIGPGVIVGDGTSIANHVTIYGPTTIGRNNRIYSYASVGQDPQDKKYAGEGESVLDIGDENTIREFVTLNRGTDTGGGVTRIGHRNWIMAYVHVAHDCHVGDETILANNATLGGHVTVEDYVYLGGFTAVHQFCAIGRNTMTGGHTMIPQDVPPYVIAAGNRARLFGLNKVGLERAGFPAEEVRALERAYRLFYRSKLTAEESLARIEAELSEAQHVQHFVAFIRKSSRGIMR